MVDRFDGHSARGTTPSAGNSPPVDTGALGPVAALPLVLAVGDLVLERGRRTVLWRGRRLRLRRRQFDLLVALAAQPGRVLSRADLLIATQSQAGTPRTRTIDVQIGQLRGLLAGCRVTIETVRGRGYRLIDCTAEQSGHGKQNFAPILPELHRPLMVGH